MGIYGSQKNCYWFRRRSYRAQSYGDFRYNSDSLLDIADMVFIDPPGTGYSRAILGENAILGRQRGCRHHVRIAAALLESTTYLIVQNIFLVKVTVPLELVLWSKSSKRDGAHMT